jgi:hypothetical protein
MSVVLIDAGTARMMLYGLKPEYFLMHFFDPYYITLGNSVGNCRNEAAAE